MSLDIDDQSIKLGQETFPLVDSLRTLAGFYSVYDYGLTISQQTGVIYHRSGLGSEQIVYQIAPQIRGAMYRESESSEDSTQTYTLAFPWVILVIAFEGGNFKGVRHFYSPTHIWSLDQQLFMPNLPNTNTRGYRDTSLGWVCLYLNDDTSGFKTLREKLNYALMRHDPMGEPYNYRNMASTDGYTSYKLHRGEQEWLWDPGKWQEKTEAEGIDWTLEDGVWIPLKFNKETDPLGTVNVFSEDEGSAYTLRDAMFGRHYVYYSIEGAVLLNKYVSEETPEEDRNKMLIDQTSVALRGGTEVTKKRPPISELVANFKFDERTRKRLLKMMVATPCFVCKKEVEGNEVPVQNIVIDFGGGANSGLAIKDWFENYPEWITEVTFGWACSECFHLGRVSRFSYDLKVGVNDAVIGWNGLPACYPTLGNYEEYGDDTPSVTRVGHAGSTALLRKYEMPNGPKPQLWNLVTKMDTISGRMIPIATETEITFLSQNRIWRDDQFHSARYCLKCGQAYAEWIDGLSYEVFDETYVIDTWRDFEFDTVAMTTFLRKKPQRKQPRIPRCTNCSVSDYNPWVGCNVAVGNPLSSSTTSVPLSYSFKWETMNLADDGDWKKIVPADVHENWQQRQKKSGMPTWKINVGTRLAAAISKAYGQDVPFKSGAVFEDLFDRSAPVIPVEDIIADTLIDLHRKEFGVNSTTSSSNSSLNLDLYLNKLYYKKVDNS